MDLNGLLTRSASGDRDAFRQLYDLVSPRLFGMLLRLFDDRFVAEGILAQTMLRAWARSREFDPKLSSAEVWLTAISRQFALDFLRVSGRYRRKIGDDGGGIPIAAQALDDAGTTSVFARLDEDSARCLALAYLDGFSAREIAIRAGFARLEVKRRLHGALDAGGQS